jgi:hypothetical protein
MEVDDIYLMTRDPNWERQEGMVCEASASTVTPSGNFSIDSDSPISQLQHARTCLLRVKIRTFYLGNNAHWEAVDLWYATSNNTQWYDLGQVLRSRRKVSCSIGVGCCRVGISFKFTGRFL